MVAQLVRLLWQEERRGNGRYRCVRHMVPVALPIMSLPPLGPFCAVPPSPRDSWLLVLHKCTFRSCDSCNTSPTHAHTHFAPPCSIVVTGDHSTPVDFGDHSHEPVPFAIAHIRHVVSTARLGQSQRAGRRHCLRLMQRFPC